MTNNNVSNVFGKHSQDLKFMTKLIFLGKITSLDQKIIDVHVLSKILVQDKGMKVGDVKSMLKITMHDVYVEIHATYDIDIDSAFKAAEQTLEDYINSLTLFTGIAYEFLFTSIILPNGDFLPVVKAMPDFSERMNTLGIDLEDVFTLRNKELLRALNDLRSAIKSFKDKGFHCFRAIESVRRYFDEIEDLKEKDSKSKGWTRLNSELLIDGESSMLIAKKFALTQRHGGSISMDADSSKSTLEFTREIITRFAFYLKNGEKTLKFDKFQLLKYAKSSYKTSSELLSEGFKTT